MKPALVILAAGESRRLGTCKALLRLGPRTALEHILVEAACLERVPALIVTGAHHAEIVLACPRAELLYNPDWSAGRSGGLRLAALARAGQDLLIAPVDCPLVPALLYSELCARWEEHGAPALGWLAPVLCAAGAGAPRRHGHPLVVGRELLSRLSAAQPDRPLSRLRELAAPLLELETVEPAVLDNLDTPEEVERARRRLAGG